MKTLNVLVFFLIISNLIIAQPQHYYNEEYNYQIDFPSGWKYFIPKETYHVVRCEFREDSIKSTIPNGSVDIMILQSRNDDDSKNMADADIEITNIIGHSLELIHKDEITLNDANGIMQIYEYNFRNDPERYLNICYYFTRDNKCYKLSFSGLKEFYNKNKEIVDNALQSYKME